MNIMLRKSLFTLLIAMPCVAFSNSFFLKSFDVYYNGDKVDIVWEAGMISNNGSFVIERSTDAVHFEELKKITAEENTSSMVYLEEDATPIAGTSYYRLKQTDENGLEIYSSIRTVKSYEALAAEMNLYANPCDEKFSEHLKELQKNEILVVLRDKMGVEFYSKITLTNNECTIEAVDNGEALPKGEYVVTASSKNELYTQIIKIN